MTDEPAVDAVLVEQLRIRVLELQRVWPGTDAWLVVAALHTDPQAFAVLLTMLERTLAARLSPAPDTARAGPQ